ncbi:MAG: sigma-70 region 4 domain protein [Marmoricola sp.]|nr:sigma-70 region 4 domain protein [Marmoricola sp.]
MTVPHAAMSNAERDERTIDLLTEAMDGDQVDRETAEAEAVALNMPLVHYLAGMYRRRGIADEDLHQVACVGLMKAIRGFTPGRSTGFAAYAIPTIRGELRRHFRDAGWTIRPPRRIQELQPRIRRAEADLVQQLQRSPTVNELAAALDVEIDDVLEAASVGSCFAPRSLDAPVSFENADVRIDLATDGREFAHLETWLLLEPAMTILSERDRRILHLRFVDDLSQSQIGELIGLSQMQVSRILGRILDQMRGAILGQAA